MVFKNKLYSRHKKLCYWCYFNTAVICIFISRHY